MCLTPVLYFPVSLPPVSLTLLCFLSENPLNILVLLLINPTSQISLPACMLTPCTRAFPPPPISTLHPNVTMSTQAHGDICGRRDQADPARPAAVLRQAEGQREEQETVRSARRAGVQPGISSIFLFK